MEEKIPKYNTQPKKNNIIKVIGVGGGGSNAVTFMYNRGIQDVDFIVCNTDIQALNLSPVPAKLQIGANLTEGLGAGANPETGREAAMESKEEIRELLSHDTKMLFITAGMGGGTGTGAAPVIAQIAKELGILTVAIVTSPFSFEGPKKKHFADIGLNGLRENCDTVLVISNDKLREVFGNLKMSEAFQQADNVLTTAAKGIAEIITLPGYINVDFEDVKTVMRNSGSAVMGSAKTEGENRAVRAVQETLSSPLLNNKSIHGAKKILLSIVSGDKSEMQMDELTSITDFIREKAGESAEMIFGHSIDTSLGDSIRVTLIATGFDENAPENKEVTPKEKAEDKKEFIFDVNSKSDPTLQKKWENEKREENKIVFNLDDEIEESEITNASEEQDVTKSEIDLKKERLTQQAEERINKLKKLSKNSWENNEQLKEKIEVPAYLRRNVKLIDLPHSAENNISRFKLNDDNQILGNNKFFTDKTD